MQQQLKQINYNTPNGVFYFVFHATYPNILLLSYKYCLIILGDFMKFETERLILRPWQKEDSKSLYTYAKNPNIGPIAGWPVHTCEEDSLFVIQNVFNNPEDYAICLKDNIAIGAISLKLNGQTDMTDRDDECELGYWIGEEFWGNGYVPEAAGIILKHGFEDLKMTTIWCGYYDGNFKSKHVQEKLGFVYHHSCDDLEVLNEIRIGHTNEMTKERWYELQSNR